MKTILTAALIAVILTASGLSDDMFRADGKAKPARTFSHEGRTLHHVQLGTRVSGGVVLWHRDGCVTVPLSSLPALWRSAFYKREAVTLAGPDAKPATVAQLAAALPAAAQVGTEPVKLTASKSGAAAPQVWLIAAADAKRLLVVSGDSAWWVADAYFADPAAARAGVEQALKTQLKTADQALHDTLAKARDPFAAK